MKLTDKCKEDYLKWYRNVYSKKEDIHEDGNSIWYMPESMQFGVIVDFFDSVGILISISAWFDGLGYDFDYDIRTDIHYEEKGFGTRQKAREQAIIKANQIYNERK